MPLRQPDSLALHAANGMSSPFVPSYRPITKGSRVPGAQTGAIKASAERQTSRQSTGQSPPLAAGGGGRVQVVPRSVPPRSHMPALSPLGTKPGAASDDNSAGTAGGNSVTTGQRSSRAGPDSLHQPQPSRPAQESGKIHPAPHPAVSLRHPPSHAASAVVSHSQDGNVHSQQQQHVQRMADQQSRQPVAASPAQHSMAPASHMSHHAVAPSRAQPSPAMAQAPPSPQATEEAGVGESGERLQARRQLKVEDALAYLEQVKSQFDSRPTVYNHFLDIMKEFKAQTIDTTEVIKRVSGLFTGHKDLILGFNTFLPPGYKIEVRENRESGILSTGFSGPRGFSELPQQQRAADARDFAPPARQGSEGTGTAGPSAVAGSGQSPAAAGAGGSAPGAHPRILANSSATKRRPAPSPRRKEGKAKAGKQSASAQPDGGAAAVQTSTPGGKNTTPAIPPPSYVHAKEVGVTRVCSSASEVPPSGARRSAGQPDDAETPDLPTPVIPRQPGDFDDALVFISALKQQLPAGKFERFLSFLRNFEQTPVGFSHLVNELVDVIGVENKDIIAEFMQQLPDLSQIAGAANGLPEKRRGLQARRGQSEGKGRRGVGGVPRGRNSRIDGGLFFEEVKKELGTDSLLYQEFIKCVSLFSNEIISRDELVNMASGLFKDHDHLKGLFVDNLEALTLGFLDSGETGGADSSASSAPGGASQTGTEGVSAIARQERYRSKPLSEICADSVVTGTTSYKKMPDDYPSLACTGRSALERKTMNDVWVSVTSGSEDYSFKFMRKNAFEDNLFRCEDDRYELDMVIETNSSTILKLEPIAATISKLPPSVKERHFLAEGALSQINFLAIRRLYGDDGADVVQAVKLNPAQAIPGVLNRLRRKDEQWRRLRSEYNAIWRDVGEKNYHRSLDHRSTSFKQVDKKELSSKSLLLDILDPKASHCARQNEMTRARGYAVASGGGRPNDRSRAADAVAEMAALGQIDSVPHLELPYDSENVHKAVYALVSRAILTNGRDDHAESSANALQAYTRFVNTFFGTDVDKEGKSSGNASVQEPHVAGRERGVVGGESGGESSGGKAEVVMYGDESMYLFFRLHHLLFERLNAAKEMAEESAADQAFRRERDVKGRSRVSGMKNMVAMQTAPSNLSRDMPVPQVPCLPDKDGSADFMLNGGIACAAQLFDEYLSVLLLFLSGGIDLAKYEDRCRVLLGADAYCVSTVDKALTKLVKQILLVFGAASVPSEFLVLFQKSRSHMDLATTAGSAQGIESMHSIAAAATLRKYRGAGAHLFRFQHVTRPGAKSQLAIHVIGTATNDDDDAKRADEAVAIDRFLGFSLGYGSKSTDEGTSGVDEGICSDGGSDFEMGEDTSSDPDCGTSGGRRNRKRGRDDVSELPTGKDDGLSALGTGSRKRRKETDIASRAFAPFRRFVGPADRLSKYRLIVRNEIECRVGPNRRLMFLDGKVDVLVKLGRKRVRETADVRSDDSRSRLASQNSSSAWTRKFRSFVENSLAGSSEGRFATSVPKPKPMVPGMARGSSRSDHSKTALGKSGDAVASLQVAESKKSADSQAQKVATDVDLQPPQGKA